MSPRKVQNEQDVPSSDNVRQMKGAKMKIMKTIIVVAACCAILGCDSNAIKNPPITITFRQGVLSKDVMQVNNLSTAEGIEVYVYVANTNHSIRSGNVVVPANGVKEFGALELDWEFKSGDRGFVCPVRYGKKLFFKLENNLFTKWFGYDDIPEVDVAAQVRARQIAEHVAWLKAETEAMRARGVRLFAAITQANTERAASGLAAVWPHPKPLGTFSDRAKDKLSSWKDKIAAKIGSGAPENTQSQDANIADLKFRTSGEYFDCLLHVHSIGSENHDPYVSNVVVDVVSSSNPKDGSLPADAVRWSVLSDVTDDMTEGLPVLVSANFPCEKLRSFWDGKECANEIIPLAATGDTKNESFVVVYNNGRVKALPAAMATLSNIYSGPFNTCNNGYNRQLQYITPKGVVNAVGTIK